jgi:diguanylate cyclase (GGDEF)-like protein/PAS domain S-box-containing protein
MSTAEALPGAASSPGGPLDDIALLEVLVDLPEAVVVVDPECQVLWGNRAAEVFFGRTLDSSVGMSGFDLVHPDDMEFALLSLATVQLKPSGLPIEVRLRSTSGWRLAELVGAPLSGSVEGAIALSIRDLTERRSLEVASDDVAKFRSLVHNAASLMMLVSGHGIVEAASGALARLLGQDPVAVAGHPLIDLVDPADHDALRAGLETSARGPQGAAQAPTVEVALLHLSHHSTVPFELTIVNLLEDPTVGAFVVTGHDLTARTVIENELRSTLSLLSATLDATGDGILVVGLDGHITSVNRKFAQLWHLPDDLLDAKVDAAAIDYVLPQLANPEVFAAKVAELYARPDAHSHDVLHFLDGRVFDRYSQPQYVDGEIVGRVWSFRDSTERNRLEEQLAHQALHDPLTNLANQTLFRDRVGHALTRWDRSSGNLAVVFLDIDNFKTVNDSLGHSAGDLLLVGVTERLRQCLRVSDTAARLGGDEFAVLLEDAGTEEDVKAFAQRLLGAFKRTFTIEPIEAIEATEVSASLSIGIAFATPGASGDQLLRNADLAMYTAKRKGKGRFEVYEEAMHATAVRRLQEEAELRRAIEHGELAPTYQPIVELATGRIVAVEALARWHHPVRGELRPEAFIDLAQETGLIADISQHVLDQACADLRRWQEAELIEPSFAISVNLAPQQLVGDALLGQVNAALVSHCIDPRQVILEITEGGMMLDTNAAIANLTGLRGLGLRIAVDDFGTGYSSLAYLQRFPIDILKIDKSFVDGVDGDAAQSALTHAVIRLAETLDLTPIAEGVERASQREQLLALGCELAQGYYFAMPAPFDVITARLRTAAR